VGAPPRHDAESGNETRHGPARVGTVEVHGQATWAGQSLAGRGGERRATQTATLFVAARVAGGLDVYLNPEVALGGGVANGGGFAAYPSGELIGQQLYGDRAYLARYFARWVVPLARDDRHDDAETGENSIGEHRSASRLEVRLGRLSVADLIDANGYANNPRTQFLNNAFGNNLAFDFAQEPRGYGDGVVLSWVNPRWTLHAASFALPTVPGGAELSRRFGSQRGDQVELELRPGTLLRRPPFSESLVVRLLAFRDVAVLGRYDDALAVARVTGEAPDLALVRRPGATKWGYGLNIEQALADGGATGLFVRFGRDDAGGVENVSYAQCDRFASLGGQVGGARWHGQAGDRAGLGWARSGAAGAHRAYLEAGGAGLALAGDAALRYGPEQVVEAYYSRHLGGVSSLTLDWQRVWNPGYDRSRGPVNLFALRLHTGF
jgi:hypothetical protein